MEERIEKEYADIIALSLFIENTPKYITEEDGDQPPMPDNRIEYGAAIPEDHNDKY